MKMAATSRLVVWAALAALAATQGPSPQAADDVPVPKGWHVVALTSPKGADTLPGSGAGGALTGPPLSPEQNALNALTAEEKTHDAEEVNGQKADSEASDEELSSQTSQGAGNAGNADGIPIPAGFRIEGLTPGASAPPAVAPAAPAQPSEAAQSDPSVASGGEQSASNVGSADNADDLQIPAGYSIEASTAPAGPSAVPPPPNPSADAAGGGDMPAPAVATTAAESAGPPVSNLKVDGLDVPAGWKITKIIDDESSGKPQASDAKPAVAKVAPIPSVPSVVIAMKKEHKPVPVVEAAPTPEKVSEQAATSSRLVATAVPVQAASETAELPQKLEPMPMAISQVEGPVDGTPGVLDEDGGVPSLEPVRADQLTEQSKIPFLPSETLDHITSVDCLTETIDNGGRPCNNSLQPPSVSSPAATSVPLGEQLLGSLAAGAQHLMQGLGFGREADITRVAMTNIEPTPALRKPLATKGSAHPVQSITQVVPQHVEVSQSVGSATLTEAQAPPQRHQGHHKEAKVTPLRKLVGVVQHEHHEQHRAEVHEPQVQREDEAPSMAELVSQDIPA